jgi:hypothetical protein
MNHITNYYKNKCEILNEQLNSLQNTINTLLTEKSRGFDVAQEQQNLLHPPNWYRNRGLPNPWDAMDPKQRSRELQRLLDYWSSMDIGAPGLQTVPNMPFLNPRPAEFSIGERLHL